MTTAPSRATKRSWFPERWLVPTCLLPRSTLIDDDFDVTLARVIEGDATSISENAAEAVSIEVTATLKSTRTSPITILLNFSGTATSAAYSAGGTHSITIGAGATTGTATVTIDPNDDEIRKGDRTIIIGGRSSGLQIRNAPAVMITDNETAPDINLSVSHTDVDEGAGSTSIVVTAEVDGALLASATTVSLTTAGDRLF